MQAAALAALVIVVALAAPADGVLLGYYTNSYGAYRAYYDYYYYYYYIFYSDYYTCVAGRELTYSCPSYRNCVSAYGTGYYPFCGKCPTGKYQPSTYGTSCRNVNAGYYQNQYGMSSAKSCPAGKYQPYSGRSSCYSCPSGKYTPYTRRTSSSSCWTCYGTTNSARSTCYQCTPGKYYSGGSCYNCPAGKYQNSYGQTGCKDCRYGTYQNQVGQKGCKTAASNYYTTPGSYSSRHTSQSVCPKGYFCKDGGAIPCGCYYRQSYTATSTMLSNVNSYCSSSRYYQPYTGRTSCYTIPTGYYGPSQSRPYITTYVTACPKGKYQNSNGQRYCKNCSPGKYQPYTGQTSCPYSCRSCSFPFYYKDTNQCESNQWGSYANTVCLQCSHCAVGKVRQSCGLHGGTDRYKDSVCTSPPTPPTITLTGATSIRVAGRAGSYRWSDPGYRTNKGTITVDYSPWNRYLKTIGHHVVTYTATYSGLTTRVFRKVEVYDNTAPSLSGVPASETIEAGGTYCASNTAVCPAPWRNGNYLSGVTASDNVDGSLTNFIQVYGSVNRNKVGAYTLTYRVQDSEGNVRTQSCRITVTETQRPKVWRLGPSTITLGVGDTYHEPGVRALDLLDTLTGRLTTSITYRDASGNARSTTQMTQKPGTYTAYYRAVDTSSRATQITRKIVVEDRDPPTITNNQEVVRLQAGASSSYDESDAKSQVTVDDPGTHCGSVALQVLGVPINTRVPGVYTVEYRATDCHGNSAEPKTRTVVVADSLDPTLQALPSMTIPVGGTFSRFSGVWTRASDAHSVTTYTSANIASYVSVSPSSISTAKPDVFFVTYVLSDAAGNSAAPVTRKVTVKDVKAPTIALVGLATMTVEAGGKWCTSSRLAVCPNPWTDPGVTASDDVTKTGLVESMKVVYTFGGQTVSGIDKNTPGTFKVKYTVTDDAGLSASVERTVIVADRQAPVIHMNGGDMVVAKGSPYTDPGCTALDLLATYTNSLTVTHTASKVDVNRVGTYQVVYTANDGLRSTTATRQITVKTTGTAQPVIKLSGPLFVRLEAGSISASDYYLNSFSATDPKDGDITSKVSISNPIPAALSSGNIPADFQIKYSVTNTDGIAALTAIRHVVIEDTTPPTLTLKGADPLEVAVGASYSDPGVTVADTFWSSTSSQMNALKQSVTASPSSISTSSPKTVRVTYTAEDIGENVVSVTRTVIIKDKTPPVLSTASSSVTVEGGGTWCDSSKMRVCDRVFTEASDIVTATDNVDGDITSLIDVDGTVDLTEPGTYTLTYTIKDAAGNQATPLKRTVTVTDKTDPSIVLLGANPLTLQTDDKWFEPGFVARDLVDSAALLDVSVTVTGTVDMTKPGTYIKSYVAKDRADHSVTVKRTVVVEDAYKPLITLLGNPLVVVEAGGTYSEPQPAATASDFEDPSPQILSKWVPGPLDTSKPGTFEVQYWAKDSKGKLSDVVRRIVLVEDSTPPVLTIDPLSITVSVGDPEPSPVVKITDNVTPSTTLKNKLVVTSTYQDAPGTFLKTFNVRDDAGNAAAQQQYTIVVKDTTKPVLTLKGDASVVIEAGGVFCDPSTKVQVCPHPYVDAGATASDNVDDDILLTNAIVATGSVDVHKPGTYTISFSVTDSAGNQAVPVTRTVKVQDTTKPVIVLSSDEVTIEAGSTYTDVAPIVVDRLDSLTPGPVAYQVSPNPATLDTSKAGSITLTYSATDEAGNKADPKTRTVVVSDKGVPVIVLKGEPFVTIEATPGQSFTKDDDPGVTVTDTADDNVAWTATGLPIDLSSPGEHVIIYSATDKNGKAATPVKRIVIVVDSTPPTITLNGGDTITIEAGIESFVDPGVTLKDAVTTETILQASLVVFGTVDDKVPSVTKLTYSVEDEAGNQAESINRVVKVVDRTPPTITVAKTQLTVEAGGTFCGDTNMLVCPRDFDALIPAATASDNVDASKHLTPKIKIVDDVDLANPGDYQITYNLVDSADLSAPEVVVEVTVQDTKKPVIFLLGEEVVEVEGGTTYNDDGAVAVDETDTLAGVEIDVVSDADQVDTSKPNTYTVTFSAKDRAGNQAVAATRTVKVVDTSAPVIFLKGASHLTLEAGATYTEQGATVEDTIDDNTELAKSIVISGLPSSDPMTWTTTGVKIISYDVTDSAGVAAATVKRYVVVEDTTKPVLTLKGDNPVTVEAHPSDPYVDAGVDQLSDVVTPKLTLENNLKVTSNVRRNVPGTYKETWTTFDDEGNVASVTRTVIVKDSTKPVVTLIGDADITIEAGGKFCVEGELSVCPNPWQDPGAEATDSLDGDLTALIQVTGTVDRSTPATQPYQLSYAVLDDAGNAAQAVTRKVTVQDNTPPFVLVVGAKELTYELGDTYDELGFSCADTTDTPLNKDLTTKTEHQIDMSKAGSYVVVYSCTDSAGNTGSATRTVQVTDTTQPTITLLGNNPIVMEAGDSYSDAGAKALDVGGTVDLTNQIQTTGLPFDTKKVGAHDIKYDVKDSAGISALTVVRTVVVQDTTNPTVTLKGDNPVTHRAATPYTDAGIDKSDIVTAEADLKVTITDSVNVNAPGTYHYVFHIEDAEGNIGIADRTVVVQDQVDPVLILNGDTDSLVWEGGHRFCEGSTIHLCPHEFEEPGFSATDDVDGDLTDSVQVSGQVKINKPSTTPNVLSYSVADKAGHSVSKTRKVLVQDTRKPIITMSGPQVVLVEGGAVYNEVGGVICVDEVDTAATGDSLAISDDHATVVDTSVAGSYLVTFTCVDAAGNAADPVQRNVTVVDRLKPTLTLIGKPTYVVEGGDTYEDPGATASDIVDDDAELTAKIQVTGLPIDTKDLGEHTITYNVKDARGLAASPIYRTVIVHDTTDPEITLIGDQFVDAEAGTSYTDAGVTVSDEVTSTQYLMDHLEVTNHLDLSSLGTYQVVYTCRDESNNAARPVARYVTVIDTTPPNVTIVGDDPLRIEAGDDFVDPGATAKDFIDGDLTYRIKTETNVNTSTPGTFWINYTVSDVRSGNANTAMASRVVEVVDTTPPVITLLPEDDPSVTVEGGSAYVEPGFEVHDLVSDGQALAQQVVVTGTVDTLTLGDSTLFYDVKDDAGNAAATVNRTVTVVDTTPPTVVSIKGGSPLVWEGATEYQDPGVEITDNIDDEVQLQANLVVDTSDVDVHELGNFSVEYSAFDVSGNVGSATRVVTIVDTTAPTIELVGSASFVIEAEATGEAFADPGFTVQDTMDQPTPLQCVDDVDCPTPLQLTITGLPINTTVPRVHTISYEVADLSDNQGTPVQRTVEITDTTPPQIDVTGDTIVRKLVCPFAVSPTVCNPATQYETVRLTLSADRECADLPTDGSEAPTLPPLSTPSCDEPDTQVYDPAQGACVAWSPCARSDLLYQDEGAVAWDIVDGDLTHDITTNNPVDDRAVGEYLILYSVSDAHGNVATANRTVEVMCADGQYWQGSKCIDCEVGFSCPGGVKTPCNGDALGARGGYQDEPGQATCKGCPFFATRVGSTAGSSAAHCQCSDGYDLLEVDDATHCMVDTPLGPQLVQPNDCASKVAGKDDTYWRCVDHTAPVLFGCPAEEVVLETQPGTTLASLSSADLSSIVVRDNCNLFDQGGVEIEGGSDFAPLFSSNCLQPIVTLAEDGTEVNTTVLLEWGVTKLTIGVRDPAGLEGNGTCAITVRVVDKEPPVIVGCPASTVELTTEDSMPTAVLPLAIVAEDNNHVTVTSSFGTDMCGAPGQQQSCQCALEGSCGTTPDCRVAPGLRHMIINATDLDGNMATCEFDVSVVDDEAVHTRCPADIIVSANDVTLPELDDGVVAQNCSALEYNDADGSCKPYSDLVSGVPAHWFSGSHTDNHVVDAVLSSHASGGLFPIGSTTTVHQVVYDQSGNKASCDFTVYACPPQRWGATCENECTCDNCHARTGQCPTEVDATPLDDEEEQRCNTPRGNEARLQGQLSIVGMPKMHFKYKYNRKGLKQHLETALGVPVTVKFNAEPVDVTNTDERTALLQAEFVLRGAKSNMNAVSIPDLEEAVAAILGLNEGEVIDTTVGTQLSCEGSSSTDTCTTRLTVLFPLMGLDQAEAYADKLRSDIDGTTGTNLGYLQLHLVLEHEDDVLVAANTETAWRHDVSFCAVTKRSDGDELLDKAQTLFSTSRCTGSPRERFLLTLQGPTKDDYSGAFVSQSSLDLGLAKCFSLEYSDQSQSCAKCQCGSQGCLLQDGEIKCVSRHKAKIVLEGTNYFDILGNPPQHDRLKRTLNDLANFIRGKDPSIDLSKVILELVENSDARRSRRSNGELVLQAASFQKSDVDKISAQFDGACVPLTLAPTCVKTNDPNAANSGDGDASSSSSSSASMAIPVGAAVAGICIIAIVVAVILRRRPSPAQQKKALDDRHIVAFTNPMYGDKGGDAQDATTMYDEPDVDKENPLYDGPDDVYGWDSWDNPTFVPDAVEEDMYQDPDVYGFEEGSDDNGDDDADGDEGGYMSVGPNATSAKKGKSKKQAAQAADVMYEDVDDGGEAEYLDVKPGVAAEFMYGDVGDDDDDEENGGYLDVRPPPQ